MGEMITLLSGEGKGLMNVKITLTELEMEVAKFVAEKINKNMKEKGIKNRKIGKQSDRKTDHIGYGGELAFCKAYNLYPDITLIIKSSDKHTDLGDAVLPDGRTVDVKTTDCDYGHLISAKYKQPKADLFALVVCNPPDYYIRGFMKREDLLQEKNLKTFGYGPSYAAKQSELFGLDVPLAFRRIGNE